MGLTNFPNGLNVGSSAIVDSLVESKTGIVTNGDTTPDVVNVNILISEGTSAFFLTNFDSGSQGQKVTLLSTTGGTIGISTAGLIYYTATAGTIALGTRQAMEFIKIGTGWYEISESGRALGI